jgi:hypothetical protein
MEWTKLNFKDTDLYALTLKAAEGQLLMAIAAANGHKIYKTGTKQAILCDDRCRMTWYTLNHVTGGRNQFLKDTSYS